MNEKSADKQYRKKQASVKKKRGSMMKIMINSSMDE
jgi:hypothetical protein